MSANARTSGIGRANWDTVEQLQHVVECTGPRVDDVRDFLRAAGSGRSG